MKASFYRDLQSSFSGIRIEYSKPQSDLVREKEALQSISNARRTIAAHSPESEKEMLLYCIDTLASLIREGNRQKIFDFTEVIYNIPEIYTQERKIDSFYAEIKAFRRKYGKAYFSFVKVQTIKPKFNKKPSKNYLQYFLPESDDAFKKAHPTGYKILCFLGLAVLLIPYLIYLVYVLFIEPCPNEWPLLLGFIGTFIIGAGFFNIIAAFIHQYMGHLFTILSLLFGSALTALSLYLLYT